MINSGISEENQKENLLKIGYKNLQQDNPAETLPEAEKVRKYGFSFTDGKESMLISSLLCNSRNPTNSEFPDFRISRFFRVSGFSNFLISGSSDLLISFS